MEQDYDDFLTSYSERPRLSFIDAISACFKKYAIFKGRSRRSEFWWFNLFLLCIIIWWSFFVFVLVFSEGSYPYSSLSALIVAIFLKIVLLVFFIPSATVTVRRLHDIGRSAWWYVVFLLLIALLCSLKYIMAFFMRLGDSSLVVITTSYQVLFYTTLILISILSIALLVFFATDSDTEENKYGLSPKYQ
ncbi:MAG: DUF805 domain-containing protein [Muribaculaceae bacterium]|nr:DUF805 domain-containing protein [Muribaculaceae bacterium]